MTLFVGRNLNKREMQMNERIDVEEIKALSVGRWPGILQELGIDVGDGKHMPCPICKGGKDRFRFTNKDNCGMWICNQCGAGDGWHLVQRVLNVDFMGAVEAVAKVIDKAPAVAVVERDEGVSKEYFREIFVSSVKAHKTNLVGRYLLNRGLNTVPDCLRLHKGLREPDSGETFPCMIALVRMPDGTAATMHRTWIVEPGQKAPIEKPKKMMPVLNGYRGLDGAAIRLFEYSEELGVLGIAEGIETAIACHEIYAIPVWAAANSIQLTKWIPPKEMKQIVVFGDNDKNYTGQKAAYCLANKLVLQGVSVDVEIPDHPGDFLNELLNFKHLGD